MNLKYTAAMNGSFDVTEDDLHFFPDYPIFDILNELAGQVSRDFLVERGFLSE